MMPVVHTRGICRLVSTLLNADPSLTSDPLFGGPAGDGDSPVASAGAAASGVAAAAVAAVAGRKREDRRAGRRPADAVAGAAALPDADV